MMQLVAVLYLAAATATEPVYFRLELSPSGSQVSIGEPAVRGSMVVFRAYPDGKLMSVRRSDVRSSTRITAKEAAGPPPASLVSIGALAMQGGGATTSLPTGKPAPGSARSSGAPRVVATNDGMAITTAAPDSPAAPK